MPDSAPSLVDPFSLHSDIETPAQYLTGSGLDSEMQNPADLGEQSYLVGETPNVNGGMPTP